MSRDLLVKRFYLTPEEYGMLMQIRQDEGLTNDSAALRYLIKAHLDKKKKDDAIEEILERLKKEDEILERLKWAAKNTEENSVIAMDVLNTVLFSQGIKSGIMISDAEHPVVTESREKFKEKISRLKQIKDNGRLKRNR